MYEATIAIEDFDARLHELEVNYAKLEKFKKASAEFRTYIDNNRGLITNYGERWRYGELISTAFVESTVNAVISKRFTKKQQMQWTSRGAHLLLQTRSWVLNGELSSRFRKWYPNLGIVDRELKIAA